jgi:hypothetical protein
MEATQMKRIGIISTATLSSLLLFGIAVPLYAQQDDKRSEEAKPAQEKQQQESKPAPQDQHAQQAKPAQQKDQHAQQAKPAQQKNQQAQQGKPSAQKEQHAQQNKPAPQKDQHAQQQQHSQPTQHANGGRIPDDRYQANFGREHTFRVSQSDYSSRRFQYSGYSFGFVDPWPSNWLYTQNVFVVYIDGVYYLCNPMYPGVNIALNIAM